MRFNLKQASTLMNTARANGKRDALF